jgi:poly(3-hydroxybutyrate) depolymerase
MNLLFLVALLSICCPFARADEPNDINLPQPGREFPFNFDGHKIVLYLPLNYNDINSAPVIFFYHGQGGQPNVDFFRHVTDSKGFIIVGMSYADEPEAPVTRGKLANYIRGEIKRLGKLKLYLERDLHLKMDDRKLIIAGISKGGWMANDLLEYRPTPWAGAVILAAGRRATAESSKAKSFEGKAVYIGAGEQDPNLRAAQRARDFLRRAGADVTFEMYEGLGHAVKPDSTILRRWLSQWTKTKENK